MMLLRNAYGFAVQTQRQSVVYGMVAREDPWDQCGEGRGQGGQAWAEGEWCLRGLGHSLVSAGARTAREMGPQGGPGSQASMPFGSVRTQAPLDWQRLTHQRGQECWTLFHGSGWTGVILHQSLVLRWDTLPIPKGTYGACQPESPVPQEGSQQKDGPALGEAYMRSALGRDLVSSASINLPWRAGAVLNAETEVLSLNCLHFPQQKPGLQAGAGPPALPALAAVPWTRHSAPSLSPKHPGQPPPGGSF